MGAFVESAAVKFNQKLFSSKRENMFVLRLQPQVNSIQEGRTKLNKGNMKQPFYYENLESSRLFMSLNEVLKRTPKRIQSNAFLRKWDEREDSVCFEGILYNEFFRPSKLKREQTRAGRSTYNTESSQIAVGLGLFSLLRTLSLPFSLCLSRNERIMFSKYDLDVNFNIIVSAAISIDANM